MATFDYPIELKPEAMEWASIKSSIQFKSPFSGATESIEFPGERWGLAITLPPRIDYEGGQAEAFFSRIAGGMERVRIGNFMRPVPIGTMRGTPTLNADIARGDLSLRINTTGGLKAGDFFKVAEQLYQCFQSCQASAGVLTVPLVQRVRKPSTAGASVLWDRPTALFVMLNTTNRVHYGTGILDRMQIDMEEVYL